MTNRNQELEYSTPESENKFSDTTVYINAGGRGTRLETAVTAGDKGVVKALLEFNGQFLVQHHINLISKLGFRNIIVGAGDHDEIKERISGQEVEGLEVISSDVELGTGGDLIEAVRGSNEFGPLTLVENVDTLLYIKDIGELIEQHKKTGGSATIVLTTKKGVPNEGAFMGDEQQRVLFTAEADLDHALVQPATSSFQGSSTGVVLFDTDFLRQYEWEPKDGPISIYRDIIPELIANNALYYYNNENNFIVDVGTPKSFTQISEHSERVLGALGQRYERQIDKDKK